MTLSKSDLLCVHLLCEQHCLLVAKHMFYYSLCWMYLTITAPLARKGLSVYVCSHSFQIPLETDIFVVVFVCFQIVNVYMIHMGSVSYLKE